MLDAVTEAIKNANIPIVVAGPPCSNFSSMAMKAPTARIKYRFLKTSFCFGE